MTIYRPKLIASLAFFLLMTIIVYSLPVSRTSAVGLPAGSGFINQTIQFTILPSLSFGGFPPSGQQGFECPPGSGLTCPSGNNTCGTLDTGDRICCNNDPSGVTGGQGGCYGSGPNPSDSAGPTTSNRFPTPTPSDTAVPTACVTNAQCNDGNICTVDACIVVGKAKACDYSAIAGCGGVSVDLKSNNSDGPLSVTSGTSITNTWTSVNAVSCTASSAWVGAKATSGSQVVGPAATNKQYLLTCSNSMGLSSQDNVDIVIPTPTPSATPTISPSLTPTPTATATPTPTSTPIVDANPRALNVTVDQPNYCIVGNGNTIPVNVRWTYNDAPENDAQKAYRVQIDDDIAFGSPNFDTGEILSNSTATGFVGSLQYSKHYYTRVCLRDVRSDMSQSILGNCY